MIDTEWKLETTNTEDDLQTREKWVRWSDVETLIGFPLDLFLPRSILMYDLLLVQDNTMEKGICYPYDVEVPISVEMDRDGCIYLKVAHEPYELFSDGFLTSLFETLEMFSKQQRRLEEIEEMVDHLDTSLSKVLDDVCTWHRVAVILMFACYSLQVKTRRNELCFDTSSPLVFEDSLFLFYHQRFYSPLSEVRYTLCCPEQQQRCWRLQYQSLEFHPNACFFRWKDVESEKQVLSYPILTEALNCTFIPRCVLCIIIHYLKPALFIEA